MAGPFGVGVLTPSAARREIESAAFDALGMTVGEHEAVHAAVTELASNRRRRARSA